jgi:2-amino-4-hydroxy-6-hydroxymethyldihydropteridine diphosphokinase
MAIVYIAVGSNLGKRFENVKHALELIRKEPTIQFIKASPFYETTPENIEGEQSKFINGVWKVNTEDSAENLLGILQKIEASMGRESSEKNLPRTIDLDILFYDSEVIESEKLTIPHPRLAERYFVLKPLCDLATDLRHPVTRLSTSQLLKMCQEKQSADHQESQKAKESIECA